MAIVAGFDVHRNQITFDALETETGELSRGRIPSMREAVAAWVGRFPGQRVDVAVEACTGWLFVCEALVEAGAVPHLADPAEVSVRRGKKPRAKTDRADARHLRQLLAEGRLPERVAAAGARLRVAHPHAPAQDARRRALRVAAQRIQATLFHPWRPRRERASVSARFRWPQLPRPGRAPRGRAGADPGGAGDDRCDRRPACPARGRATRAPAARPARCSVTSASGR
jgi:hypothetical protein